MLAVLAGAALLNRWSHTGDPRFYAFLRTPVGESAARLFGWWRSPLEMPSPHKPDRRWTPTEQEVKGSIEQTLDQLGGSVPLEVTYRDVAFRLEFPEFEFRLYPPFAILSDAPMDEIANLVAILVETHDQFHPVFSPLFTQAYCRDLIHVLYFIDPDQYAAYHRRQAHGLENTAGFYSPAVNRLVLFRQDPSAAANPVQAARQTQYTIRHEAAHLFLFAYGVHSFHRIENEWLIEGLACFAETSKLGSADPHRGRRVRQALSHGTWIPLHELVDHRDPRARLLSYHETELAYCQSWALVHFLMTHYRPAFFAYLRYLRDPDHFADIRGQDRLTLLARFTGRTAAELEAEWIDHVRTM